MFFPSIARLAAFTHPNAPVPKGKDTMENTALRIATSALCAAALAVSANATTVNDGDTIAWFSLDEDFVPIDGPADIYVAECVEAGVSSYSFNSYADPHPILDEFRITKGVLPKAKFLKAQALGATVLTIR